MGRKRCPIFQNQAVPQWCWHLTIGWFRIRCDFPKQQTWMGPATKGQWARVPDKAFLSIFLVPGFLRDKHYTEIYDGATVSRMAPQLPLLILYPKNNYQSKLRKSNLGNSEQEIRLNSQKQHIEKGVKIHYGFKTDHQMPIDKQRQTPGGPTWELFSQSWTCWVRSNGLWNDNSIFERTFEMQ